MLLKWQNFDNLGHFAFNVQNNQEIKISKTECLYYTALTYTLGIIYLK